MSDRCAQPGVAKCAREWEADKQRAALEAVGLAEEFPFGCDAIEHVAEALVACRAENARLKRTNGRRERHILRARLQEAGAPVGLEWLGDVERIWPEARVTQRLCSALRRAWDERDKARAAVASAPHGDACHIGCVRQATILGCDCWKARADA